MSRSPERSSDRVLQALTTYHRLDPALQRQWWSGSRYSLRNYASPSDIRAYEAGRRVPLSVLLRDIGCTRADLSRALKSLARQELVRPYAGDLEHVGYEDRFCKCRHYARRRGLA